MLAQLGRRVACAGIAQRPAIMAANMGHSAAFATSGPDRPVKPPSSFAEQSESPMPAGTDVDMGGMVKGAVESIKDAARQVKDKLSGAMSQASSQASSSMDETLASGERATERGKMSAKETAHEVSDMAHDLKEKVKGKAHDMYDSAAKQVEHAKEEAERADPRSLGTKVGPHEGSSL